MFEAQQALLRRARNTVKAEHGYKTVLPDGSKIDPELINDAIEQDMISDYAVMYNKYVRKNPYTVPESRQRGKSQNTEEGKKKVSEDTVEFLKDRQERQKEISDLPTPDEFARMSSAERAAAFIKLKEYDRYYDRTEPSARKFKADMEVVRSRLLNSSKIPLEVRRYLAKSDLNTIKDYLDFMEEAKRRAAQAKDSFYQDLMEEFYAISHDAAKFVNTSDKAILFNFLKFQISRSDGDRASRLITNASRIKVRGKNVFSYSDLEGYL